MSLDIPVSEIEAVMLPTGWHPVAFSSDGCSTFEIDPYEFGESAAEGRWTVHKAGSYGVCAVGFAFVSGRSGNIIEGPLTSVLAASRRNRQEERP